MRFSFVFFWFLLLRRDLLPAPRPLILDAAPKVSERKEEEEEEEEDDGVEEEEEEEEDDDGQERGARRGPLS